MVLFLLTFSMQDEAVSVEAKFLKRGELPNQFRFPLLELDFAVLRLKIENRSSQAWTLKPEQIQVQDPKGKPLDQVTPYEITPKIMGSKAFRRTNRNVHGQVGYGYPGIYGPMGQVPATPGGSGVKVISADQAQQIRSVLEEYGVKEATLAPGSSLEALVYLKSKKTPSQLAGSTVTIGDAPKISIPTAGN